ncbi:hypothetical protein Zm00014a_019112 [Zea mays]|jgi:hypothetical protein|uniref:Uncharacterized protein n=1 Tax=Zea mays TaxID=4577 RepID=A0A3L6F954_MAIZE|nr:hypothetical protein Zm00014a_019112 [Zea mays]
MALAVVRKNATTAALLLLLLLSSTVSEARHKIWHGPIIYASPPPPSHHRDLYLPYIAEQKTLAAPSPEGATGDSQWVPRKP